MVTTGRGYAYPTARETALKLMETSYLPALAFSGADLLHGPLAMTDPDVPVLAVVGSGPGGQAMTRGGRPARPSAGPTWSRSAPPTSPARPGGWPCRGSTSATSPLLDILPLQRLALVLALARGEDPDAPRGLKKVTTTL